jgi:hypothetical protein
MLCLVNQLLIDLSFIKLNLFVKVVLSLPTLGLIYPSPVMAILCSLTASLNSYYTYQMIELRYTDRLLLWTLDHVLISAGQGENY